MVAVVFARRTQFEKKKVFSVPPASAIRFRSVILWLDAHIFLSRQLHVAV